MADDYSQEYPNVNTYGNVLPGEGHEYTDIADNPMAIVRELLYAQPAIINKVKGRIYDMQMPKDIKFPCITIQRISETVDNLTFYRRTTIQVDCYSQSHPEADELAERVLSVLINHSMDTQQMTLCTINAQALRDLSLPETRLFRVTGEYAVIWRKKTW